MRQIGFIDEEDDAHRFGDYLLANGIKNNVEQMTGGAWEVWVEDDDLLDRGRAELEQFRANPSDARYSAAADANRLRKQSEKAEQRRRKQFVDVRTRWGQPSQLARPVTIVLVAISIVVSVGTKLGMAGRTPIENKLIIQPFELTEEGRPRRTNLDAVRQGEVWRLVTPIFIHYGPLHLIFNMFWLLDLGSMIETRRGSLFLLVMVLVTAVLSNVAQYYLGDFGARHSLFGGMSGVNYALFGYAWMKGRYQPDLGIGVQQQTITVMLFWLVLCMTGWVGPVANVAHVVGLLGGVGFGYLPYAIKRMLRRRSG